MKKIKATPSSEEKNEKDFPGYPHYPVSEDILNTAVNETAQVPVDVEQISRGVDLNTNLHADKLVNSLSDNDEVPQPITAEGRVKLVPGNDADVTDEEIAALEDSGLSPDDGDDELLRRRTYETRMGDSDLDIPGAELDNAGEEIGSEDEENNFYSLGGDNHDNLQNQN